MAERTTAYSAYTDVSGIRGSAGWPAWGIRLVLYVNVHGGEGGRTSAESLPVRGLNEGGADGQRARGQARVRLKICAEISITDRQILQTTHPKVGRR